MVEPGQTLYRIAKAYGVSIQDLMAANGITDSRALMAGRTLFVPGARATVAVPPPLIGSLSTQPAQRREDPGEPAPLHQAPPKSVAPSPRSGVLQWPLRGVLYARFGKKGKELHDGIDLAAPAGTPVQAAAAGSVLYAGEQPGYGWVVIIEHENGLVTLYAHNRDLRVRTGQYVRPHQVVATVGQSGKTTGPHLHFEVRRDGVLVNPLDYLTPVPAS